MFPTWAIAQTFTASSMAVATKEKGSATAAKYMFYIIGKSVKEDTVVESTVNRLDLFMHR